MEKINIEEIYKIEKDKLLRYYDRIKGQFKSSGPTQIIAKFLINQSIGSNYNEVYDTLLYFRDKLADGKELLDLAFEWIRAQKIRLEYKKYLIRAQYPYNNLSLAVDDCIFKFFQEYDRYIRNLLKKDIREHNLSALYEIFFSPYESKNLNIQDILERHIDKVPTHHLEMEKINTNVIVLRSGLSIIVIKEYEDVLFARKEEKQLLINLITNTSFLRQVVNLGKPSLFESSYSKIVAKWVWEYWEKMEKAPGLDIQEIYLKYRSTIQDEDDIELIGEFLQNLNAVLIFFQII